MFDCYGSDRAENDRKAGIISPTDMINDLIICLCFFIRSKSVSFLCLLSGNKDTLHDSPHLDANPG